MLGVVVYGWVVRRTERREPVEVARAGAVGRQPDLEVVGECGDGRSAAGLATRVRGVVRGGERIPAQGRPARAAYRNGLVR